MSAWLKSIESTGAAAPWLFVALFIAGSVLLIWRLERMSAGGVEGTVLGTLVMPYCSGAGNLIFVWVVAAHGGAQSHEVLTNSLVNNFTNLTLLIGLPAWIYGMSLKPGKAERAKGKRGKQALQEQEVNRLSLLLSLAAVLFFTGTTWALSRDGGFNRTDGMVLAGLFLFWQCFHVFDVLKSNVRQNRSFGWSMVVNLALLAAGAYLIYVSTQWLVEWILRAKTGFLRAEHLGWLSGWLMVLPNALLAFYYAHRGNPEVVYTSQVGDGHICIPLCIGLIALQHPVKTPSFFDTGLLMLVGATVAHMFFVTLMGRLPRWAGAVFCGAYLCFVYRGLAV